VDRARALVVGLGFFLLGFFGREVYRQAPPIPERVVTERAAQLLATRDILDGQQVWQSIGGQQIGSIWGHGATRRRTGPRTGCTARPSRCSTSGAREHGKPYDELRPKQAALLGALKRELRTNTYDAEQRHFGDLGADRARGAATVRAHYRALFGGDRARELRDELRTARRRVPDANDLDALTTFFFWTAWACTPNARARLLVHEQLAPRAARRQRPTSSNVCGR
jgi:nitric oxide reductase subunit B